MATGRVRATIVDMAAFQADSEVGVPRHVLLPRPDLELRPLVRDPAGRGGR
jgi:hypothetical protein